MGLSLFSRRNKFEVLVTRFQNRVYGYACYYLKDTVLAEDVTQEVFLRLWDNRNEVDEDRLLGWLIRVTRNVSIDLLRRRQLQYSVMTVDTDGLEMREGPDPSPEENAEAIDFQEHLQNALDQIGEPYKSIVILREIQDFKYEEISEALDLPLNTVKVYLHRARKMLRQQLSEVIERETA